MFGYPVIAYLFLGGVGGGTCLVVSALGILTPREFLMGRVAGPHGVFYRAAYFVAALALLFGAMCLLSDGFNFAALEHLFLTPRFTYISVGAYVLGACIVVCFALALAWTTGELPFGMMATAVRLLQVCGVVFGLAVIVYTGLLLYSMKAVPLWNSLWLPVLFALSSLSCGLVMALVVLNLTGLTSSFARFARGLARADAIVIVLEIIGTVGFVLDALLSCAEGATGAAVELSLYALLIGPDAWVFWALFVCLGLFAALVLDLSFIRRGSRSDRPYFVLIPSCCVLAGAFAMRACFVMAGFHPLLFM